MFYLCILVCDIETLDSRSCRAALNKLMKLLISNRNQPQQVNIKFTHYGQFQSEISSVDCCCVSDGTKLMKYSSRIETNHNN